MCVRARLDCLLATRRSLGAARLIASGSAVLVPASALGLRFFPLLSLSQVNPLRRGVVLLLAAAERSLSVCSALCAQIRRAPAHSSHSCLSSRSSCWGTSLSFSSSSPRLSARAFASGAASSVVGMSSSSEMGEAIELR